LCPRARGQGRKRRARATRLLVERSRALLRALARGLAAAPYTGRPQTDFGFRQRPKHGTDEGTAVTKSVWMDANLSIPFVEVESVLHPGNRNRRSVRVLLRRNDHLVTFDPEDAVPATTQRRQ